MAASQTMAPIATSHRGGHPDVEPGRHGGTTTGYVDLATRLDHGETQLITEIPRDHTVVAPIHDAPSTDSRKDSAQLSDHLPLGDVLSGERDRTRRNAITQVNARVPDQRRGETQITIHYSVPEGQRFLPIFLGPCVTMVNVGRHNDDYVYEPVNTWLQSTEEGLRFHRSMNDDDVYEGPLDMATFGRPVVGPL